jgi:menaquinone reductase, multiheme cytochrome c subunit
MMSLRAVAPFALGVLAAMAGGWVAVPRVLYRQIDQPLQFSHKVHTSEEVGLSCEDCHFLHADGRFSGIPPLENCAGCHAEVLGETPAEKRLVEEYVMTGREIPWLVYSRQPENARFTHAPHVTLAGIACERCHGPHGTSEILPPFQQNRLSTYSRGVEGYRLARLQVDEWERGMKMDVCSRCHRQNGVEQSCLTCHK